MGIDIGDIAIVTSTILSIGGEIARYIVQEVRNKQDLTINELRNYITQALNQVYSASETRGAKLSNALMNLSLIQKTPALANAVESATRKIQQKQDDLRNDVLEAEKLSLQANQKIDEADNAIIGARESKINNRKKEDIPNYVQKLQEIEQRI